jgi:hypothetical protein
MVELHVESPATTVFDSEPQVPTKTRTPPFRTQANNSPGSCRSSMMCLHCPNACIARKAGVLTQEWPSSIEEGIPVTRAPPLRMEDFATGRERSEAAYFYIGWTTAVRRSNCQDFGYRRVLVWSSAVPSICPLSVLRSYWYAFTMPRCFKSICLAQARLVQVPIQHYALS